MLPVHLWLEVLNDRWNQRFAYCTGRDMVEDVTGKESNACAAVCSIYQIMRGALDKVYYNTQDLFDALWRADYTDRFEADQWRDIRPGDVAFSKDNNKNHKPDHVYTIYSKPDKDGYCMVLDNYEPHPHRRNLLEGKRTPLAFYLRCDNMPKTRLNPWRLRVVMMGFSWLYLQFNELPLYIQQRLNALRHDAYFTTKE